MSKELFEKYLRHEEKSGELFWISRPSTKVACGDKAGTLCAKGYIKIMIKRKVYRAHRIVWELCTGSAPVGEIDHINGNKSDNRISNLRDVTSSTNNENRRSTGMANTSGFLGVDFHKANRKWRAKITVGNKSVHIGYFEDPKSAHDAYLTEKRRLHKGCTI